MPVHLEKARQLIDKSSNAKRLYAEASQLRRYKQNVMNFIENSVCSVGEITDDLITSFKVLTSFVRKTHQFPKDFVFDVETAGGNIELDYEGNIKTPDGEMGPDYDPDTGDINGIAAAAPESLEIDLNGLDVNEEQYSFFYHAYKQGRINKMTFKEFMNSPVYLSFEWPVEKLKTFYARYGSTKWIPPIMEIKQLDSNLKKRSNKKQFVKTITDEMANAGKIGF